MFDLDRWIEIGHVLSKNKLRTLLTGLGVFTGIFILIVLLGGSSALENGVVGQFRSTSTNTVLFGGKTTTLPYGGYQPGRKVNVLFEDAAYLQNRTSGIQKAYPRRGGAYFGSKVISRNGISEGFAIQGETPDIYGVEPIYTVNGRFINELDVRDRKKTAVIGKKVAEVFYQNGENPIGTYLEIAGTFFMVVGVFDSDADGRRGQDPTEIIYIPTSTYKVLFNTGDRIDYLYITFKDHVQSQEGLDEVLSLLKEKHSIHPEDQLAFWKWDLGAFYRKTSALFLGIKILMWIVGLGSFLAGVVGVTNIMLVVIKERTQEFGILRAIGARPLDIQLQVILEAVVLTTISGFIGFIAGVGVVYSGILEQFFVDTSSSFNMFKNPSVDFQTTLTALLMIVFFGAVAGWVPAKRAIQIKPVEALQTE